MKKFSVILLALVLCTVLYFCYLVMNSQRAQNRSWFSPRSGDHKPMIMAHQGGEGERPSNTMLAFQEAVHAGADVIDTDMQMTKDGVLVLIHDEAVDRTTNGKGYVRDLRLSELKKLDAAYNFTTDQGKTFPYRGTGVTVPTVEETFQAFPNLRIGIEIKPTSPLSISRDFCDLIRRYHMEQNVLVSSFFQDTMDEFRKSCPEVATSATLSEVLQFMRWNTVGMARIISPKYDCFQVPETSGAIDVITPSFIKASQERKLRILPWTINDEAAFQRLAAEGSVAINTDYPAKMLKLVSPQRR